VVELDINELVDFGKRAVDFAIRKGADEAEAFLSTGSGTSIDIERGQIVRCNKSIDQGLGVRTICRQSIGFSYGNTLTRSNVEQVVERAVKASRASKSDKNWVNLPSAKSYYETKGTFDQKVVELSSDDLVKMTANMLGAVQAYDKRVLAVAGGIGASIFHTIVVNSHGIEAYDRGTTIGCSMETIGRDGTDVTPACFELNAERVCKINPEEVGKEAARLAVSALKSKKIDSGVFPVIFTQAALHSILYFTIVNAIKADYVQRERSALKGKIGEEIGSELVTVHDDGLLDGGLSTRKFDGEGVPCQKTSVIDKGILKNFLFDNYTAKKGKTKSTGNASRPGIAPYRSYPVLSASNFIFEAGQKNTEELVEEIEEGLIVYGVQGAHSSNPESGEFSVVATPVWKIDNGEVAFAARGVMLTGVVFDLLKNVSALGNNVRKIGQLVAPWIRFEDVKVIGTG
jgi:PmbA protein